MKKPILFLAIVIALFYGTGSSINNSENSLSSGSSVFVNPSDITNNLAPNPSFEQGTSLPDEWVSVTSGASYEWSSTISHTGIYSICNRNVEPYQEGKWATVDRITVIPGNLYKMSVWVKGTADLEAAMTVAHFDASGSEVSTFSWDVLYNHTNWTHEELSNTVPTNIVSVELRLWAYNWNGDQPLDAWVCFDDVNFEVEGSYTYSNTVYLPIIVNSSFALLP